MPSGKPNWSFGLIREQREAPVEPTQVVVPAKAGTHTPCPLDFPSRRTPISNSKPVVDGVDGLGGAAPLRGMDLRRRHRERRLRAGERHAGLSAVQAPDRAGDFEDLAGRT